MKTWMIYSFLALICWGMWAFLPKIAIAHMSPKSAFVYEVMGGLLVGLVVLFGMNVELSANIRGIVPSVLTGVAGYLGLLFFLHAVQLGSLSVISSLTAVYPVITLAMAVIFLKEKLNYVQWMGIALALVSVILISRE